MAKIFRFSGYFVENDEIEDVANFEDRISELCVESEDIIQQLHIEESEEFEANGELEENCDLALLTRHFKADNTSTEFDRPLPRKGEKYKHFKVGKIVTISVFQDIQKQRKYRLCMNMKNIFGTDRLKCL